MRFTTALLVCASLVLSSVVPVVAYGHSVNIPQELMITDLRVVEDPARTTGCGPWTFCGLMTAMSGTTPPPAFTKNWLNLWLNTQYINGYSVPKRSKMSSVITDWPKMANGVDLDLQRAPFRLLAIVFRPDLVNDGGGYAGEGRFVFGLLDKYGNPLDMQIIFEYRLSTNIMSVASWFQNWHTLGSMTPGTAAYNGQLQYITDKFARTPAMFDRVYLNALRTSDGFICLHSQIWTDWEFREFTLSWGPAFSLQQNKVSQTPHPSFYGSTALRDYVNNNQTWILNGTHGLGNPLKSGGHDDNIFGWDHSGITNPEARFMFSMSTCGGCHTLETSNWQIAQIRSRTAGTESTLADFLKNVSLRDFKGQYRVHDELGRRASMFGQLLTNYGICWSPQALWLGSGQGAPPSAGSSPIISRIH